MIVHTLWCGGRVVTEEVAAAPSRDKLREIVAGDIEHVAVLFNGKRTTMIVNETGAVREPPLPENARATLIYWTATAQGMTPSQFDPLEGPIIHGNAVLYEDAPKEAL